MEVEDIEHKSNFNFIKAYITIFRMLMITISILIYYNRIQN